MPQQSKLVMPSVVAVFMFAVVAAIALPRFAPNRIVVRFKEAPAGGQHVAANGPPAFHIAQVDALNARYGCVGAAPLCAKAPARVPVYALTFRDSIDVEHAVADYLATGAFVYAEPDYVGTTGGGHAVVPNDPLFRRQWSLKNDGSFALSPAKSGADIDMTDAWGIEQGDTSVIVAIIDTGCKLDHPDFAGRIWRNTAETDSNGVDDDGDGYVDDVRGWDFANSDNNPTDDQGHGSNVSGILGANGNNGIGYAGMDWHCKIMELKAISSQDFGYYTWWSAAMYYAVNNGARVISMSLEGTSSSQVLQDAADYAYQNDVLVVACMGNENTSAPDYPAACDHVMAVGSTNANDRRSNPFFWSATSGSNYGDHISVVAPGNYVYSLSWNSDTYYDEYWGGTSQSTPHVSALASLLIAQNPERTADQVRAIIEQTADDQVGDPAEDTPGWDRYYGHGRIDAYKALAYGSSVRTAAPLRDELTIAPNPASSVVTISLPDGAQRREVALTDMLGRTVRATTGVPGQQLHISVQGLPHGVYGIRVLGGDGMHSGRVVVR